MADKLSKEHRSWNMSKIRSRNTEPEMRVRSFLHRAGFRFRLHVKHLPGSPDIVLPRHRTVIFVHGCFWHRHEGCRFAYEPKSRIEFWNEKFRKNVDRDEKNRQQLRELGWKILTIWECETSDMNSIAEKMEGIRKS